MSTPSEPTGVGGHSFTLTRFKLPKGHCSGESRSWCFAVYLDHWLSDIESNVVLRRHDFGLYVLGGALSFALCASGVWNSRERLEAASEGAVICGWLGALIGAIAIVSKSDFQWEGLGPAIGIMLLTIMYGYFVKVVVRLVLLSRSSQ